jgi:hypothetical protein
MVLQEVVLCLCSDTPHVAYEVTMKAEEELTTEVGEKPLPILFVGIKTEKEVSFASVCALLGSFYKYSKYGALSFIFMSLSIWPLTVKNCSDVN